jgi:hypothetical protein
MLLALKIHKFNLKHERLNDMPLDLRQSGNGKYFGRLDADQSGYGKNA